MPTTSFDAFAEKYDAQMGDTGDQNHLSTIDPALYLALGSVAGKRVYDIACGNGYMARKFARDGAVEVVASDISSSLIELAKSRYENPPSITYMVRDGNDFSDLEPHSFDAVAISMAIHYIKDIPSFFKNIYSILKPGGVFAFTANHPLYELAWHDVDGEKTKFDEVLLPAREYILPHEITVMNPWTKKEDLLIYRRPIGFYLEELAKAGFKIEKFIEPPTVRKEKKGTTIPFVYAVGAASLGK